MINPQMSTNMMMNNSNNQNNNDFPDQSHIAQIFNQNNRNNNQNMMNNNMNMMNNNMIGNNMSMMNNNNMSVMMNNNMGKNMNNSMMFNNMNMMNNNTCMLNNNMNMMNNNMNIMNNQMGMNNMGTMNNMTMMNNNMMNNNMINNNMMNNNMMNNNMVNNNMANNNNNMGLVRRNTFNQINWYNNNYLPYNMNSQNYLYIMKMLQNQAVQRQYYQMMFQQRMFFQMQREMLAKQNRMNMMNQILDTAFNNNNQQNDIPQQNNIPQQSVPQQIDNATEDNYVPNQALLDVIQENNPPQQNNNQNQNQNNNPILPSELVSEVIADVINLNPNLLSGLGNNLTGEWAQGENRGGRPYQPPNGWIGYGLNVLNKYDNGNNDWLACNGRAGEWCIAYHGACCGQSSDNVKIGVKSILETNLRPGSRQACRDHNDLNHPGQKVGVGVYCSPSLSVIDGYAGIMNINGHNYKTAFMLRVKPDKIRISASSKDYWVVNGDFSELRPYRLLIKPC